MHEKSKMSISPYQGYVTVKVGEISQAKLRKAIHGQNVRLTNNELSGNRVLVVHPANKDKIVKAQKKGAGVSTSFTPYEAMADLEYYDKSGGSLQGASLWSWLRDKAYPWVKKNFNVIKPVLSSVGDAVAALVPGAAPIRENVRQLTGVGVKPKKLQKGSPEAKAYMASLRARKTGGSVRAGSFRMP